jgi:hypothetical protein
MKSAVLTALAVLSALSPSLLHAQDAELELTEQTLNKLVVAVGILSDSGVAQPYNLVEQTPDFYELCLPQQLGVFQCPLPEGPDVLPPGFRGGSIELIVCRKRDGTYQVVPVGDPVVWQWWVTDPAIDIQQNRMYFTATVRTRVADRWESVTRTVRAGIEVDAASGAIEMTLSEPFLVPVVAGEDVARVDIASVNVAELYQLSLPIPPQTFAVTLPQGGTRQVTGRIASGNARYENNRAIINFDVAF